MTSLADSGRPTERPLGQPRTRAEEGYQRLTPREREVPSEIGKGLANKEIAERLSISAHTLRHHISGIYGKLQISNRAQAVLFVAQRELLSRSSPERTSETPLDISA